MVVLHRSVSLDDGPGVPADAISNHIDVSCHRFPNLRLTPDCPSFLFGRGSEDGVRWRVAAICPERMTVWRDHEEPIHGRGTLYIFLAIEPVSPGRSIAHRDVSRIADSTVLWNVDGPLDTAGYAIAQPEAPSGSTPVDVARWAVPGDSHEPMTAFAVLGGADDGTVLWSVEIDHLLSRPAYPPARNGIRLRR